MTDDSFLSRWSRRKRAEARGAVEAEAPPSPPAENPPPSPIALADPAAPSPAPLDEETPDLADLPPIESITGGTDVTAFFRKGVPAALRDAALRQAWATDPVIGTFREMADYDWDFNTPGGNQIFGPLDPSIDVKAMAERILGQPDKHEVATPDPEAVQESTVPVETASESGKFTSNETDNHVNQSIASPTREIPAEKNMTESLHLASTAQEPIPISTKVECEAFAAPHPKRRRHGAALPE